MSNQDQHTGRPVRPARTFAVSRQLVGMCVGVALTEALFFTFLAHFRHPRPLWDFRLPWVLLPAVPVLGALLGLLTARRRPARGRMHAADYGALLVGLVLPVGSGLLMLLDRVLSD